MKSTGGRLPFYCLAAAALFLAFLGGFKTIGEFDLGWQMATARWIVQHHRIPSSDVLSYTAAGQPWIYPVGSGLIFYGFYLVGGYALLSWLTACVCAGTVALVLRRGTAITAALAILAVAPIASRITARAEMFTALLFAATLSLLWQQHRTGDAPLWLLPGIMAAWVNLHPGFVAGFALFAAYLMLEAFNRNWRSLRRAAPWLAAGCIATLLNPWGWNVYAVVARQQSAMEMHSELILEWAPLPLNWMHLKAGLSPFAPDTFYLLLAIATGALMLAIVKRRFAEALLLAASAYLPARHQRLTALASIVMVIVGGAVLPKFPPGFKRRSLAYAGCALLVLVAAVRAGNLVSGRTYRAAGETVSFGSGLSWWFPQGAANFIAREHLPAQVFGGYSEGGYLSFRLGPEYKDYIDGRAIPFGRDLFLRSARLKSTPPDGAAWRAEADRYGIQTMIVPIGRYVALQFFPVLRQFCESGEWTPVYLDETGAVFVRGAGGAARIDCATAPLPRIPPKETGDTAFNQWANAASVLHALGRNTEAIAAARAGLRMHPDYGYLYFLRGHIREASGNWRAAEQDFLRATELEPGLVAPWSALGALYQSQGQPVEAVAAWKQAAAVARWAWEPFENLGYANLQAHRPQEALDAFDASMGSLPAHPELVVDNNFLANIAHGRARSWYRLGDLSRAIQYEEESVRLLPGSSDLWRQLAELYQAAGRTQEASRAMAQAQGPAAAH